MCLALRYEIVNTNDADNYEEWRSLKVIIESIHAVSHFYKISILTIWGIITVSGL